VVLLSMHCVVWLMADLLVRLAGFGLYCGLVQGKWRGSGLVRNASVANTNQTAGISINGSPCKILT
jgi:hypothetical protein